MASNAKEKTKLQLQEELNTLKADYEKISKELSTLKLTIKKLADENFNLNEEKRNLADCVRSKDIEISSLRNERNNELDNYNKQKEQELKAKQNEIDRLNEKLSKSDSDKDKELEKLKEENQGILKLNDRRTRELEEMFNLFNQEETLLYNMLDLVSKNKQNLLEKIQKE